MKMKSMTLGVFLLHFMGLQGCAHNSLEKRIDAKVAQEEDIQTGADLKQKTIQLIKSTPSLTEAQRSKLLALHDSTYTQIAALQLQSLKLRAVLIKDLVADEYDGYEIELIKRRIRDTEGKRISLALSALDQANTILDRQSARNLRLILNSLSTGEVRARLD